MTLNEEADGGQYGAGPERSQRLGCARGANARLLSARGGTVALTVLQENGVRLQDKFITGEDGCCGAIAATAQEDGNRFRFSVRDREILARIRDLESQLESVPTLGQLVELRGELLRKAGG